jgi:hypothetical protein
VMGTWTSCRFPAKKDSIPILTVNSRTGSAEHVQA